MKWEPPERFSDGPRPQAGGHWSIGDAVHLEAATSLTYALLVVGLTATPEWLGRALLRWWIGATSDVTRWALVFVPGPPALAGPGYGLEVAVYRHLLAVSLLIACVAFWLTRSHWAHWAAQASRDLARIGRSSRRMAVIGHCYMVQGFVATIVILFFGERWLGRMATFLFAEPWTFLRAPLLSTLAFAFACHAAVFKLSAGRPSAPDSRGGSISRSSDYI